MSEAMTKEQFVRKLFGDKQHQKNTWLRNESLKYAEVDAVRVATSVRIAKSKRVN